MYPTSGLGKTLGGLTMFAGLLVIAFPITILSINMSELYEEHKNQKALKVLTVVTMTPIDRLRAKVSSTSATDLEKSQLDAFKSILQDLNKSDEQVEKINKVINLVVEEHEEIRVAIQGLLGKKDIKLPTRSAVISDLKLIKEEPALLSQ